MTTHTLTHVVGNPELAARWRRATEEPAWVRWTLIGVALSFLALFLVLPLTVVLYGAFEQGLQVWWAAVNEPDALAAIRLSLLVVLIVVPINLVFGVSAAWAIAKFEFRGKPILISLIDMPFAISPVVVGLIFVILFGSQAGSAPGWRPMTCASSSPCRASSSSSPLEPCPSSPGS